MSRARALLSLARACCRRRLLPAAAAVCLAATAPSLGQVHYDPYFELPAYRPALAPDDVLVTAGMVNDLMGVVRGWQVLPSWSLLSSRTDALLAARYSLRRDLKWSLDRWGVGEIGFDRGGSSVSGSHPVCSTTTPATGCRRW